MGQFEENFTFNPWFLFYDLIHRVVWTKEEIHLQLIDASLLFCFNYSEVLMCNSLNQIFFDVKKKVG